MLIKTKDYSAAQPREVTPRELFLQRRRFLELSATTAAAAVLAPGLLVANGARAARKLSGIKKGPFGTHEELTPLKDITRYNNFYEFGTHKEDPARLAKDFRTRPWSVAIEGETEKPGIHDLDALLKAHPLEERIYRMRCVEAWSMVIPWVGFPLRDLIRHFAPTSRAKYVEFTTLYDPKQMPGQRRPILEWPYIEGLRMDEAMHPLTILAIGLYGEELPNQNGAPLRLVVPWKYGYKSIKSIVRIRFVKTMPISTWMKASGREYGFYANVNPHVDHPRWSQARERRIGELFKRKTLMFNGYADKVAGLYTGMDLRRFF